MMFIVKRDRRREYRWRLVAKNGRVIAYSGQGFKRRDAATKAIYRVRETVMTPIWYK